MYSPILMQLFSSLKIDRSIERSVYLQLADGILSLIKSNQLCAGQKLPSTREISVLFQINRITVSKAYEELQTQGWLKSFVGRGTFVSPHIPEAEPEVLRNVREKKPQKVAGFPILSQSNFDLKLSTVNRELHLDDGFPDPKLAPLKELYRAYRNQLTKGGLYYKYGCYANPAGSDVYREAMSDYLNKTRGLKTTAKNIISVKGTIMGINLVCNGLIDAGDVIVSGVPGWGRAERNFIHAKAEHITIPVDENGLMIDALKNICRKKKVRMLYVTPHHHYPTTVSLRIDRRLELLRLSNEYGFIIFEDDYDFDFHYKLRPLLPLASADEKGMVIYSGSFSKSFSPAFRMGYLVAAENVIEHLGNVRILLDRQGDQIIEDAMAFLLNDGTIQRYLRKTLAVYKERRDFFCELLSSELNGAVNFAIPEGGMTVWTEFDPSIKLETLAQKAYQKGLYMSNGKAHQYPDYNTNGVRLGFASSSLEDLEKSIAILKALL